MARTGPSWTYTEIEILLNNMDKPVAELCELLPERTKKSIERKIEKLRTVGKVGYKYKKYEKEVERTDGWGKNDWKKGWDD